MMKKIFWGMFLILVSVYLVVSQMGHLPTVGVFTIICTIACLAVFIGSIPHLHFAGLLFPVAFIGILYDEQLGITAITPWTILAAALFGTIGLHLIFGRFRKKGRHSQKKVEWENVNIENQDGKYVHIKESFGSTIRYIKSEDLEKTDISVSFGAAKIYFDHADIPSGNAVVNLKCRFAGIELYVPHNWQVINHIDSGFGAVDVDNERSGEVTATLTLCGSNEFGGIEIIYI